MMLQHRASAIRSLIVLMLVVCMASPALAVSDVQGAVDASLVVLSYDGQGSGVNIGKGRVLTAAHVITDRDDVRVRTDEGLMLASVERIDVGRDLALLSVPDIRSPNVDFLSAPVRLGEAVYVIGAPLVDHLQVSSGIASAVVQQN